jgi:DNA-binding CsgD family transcriptional regulator
MHLEPTEKQICCRIAVNGETVEQIAGVLGCHVNTVNNIIKRLKARFGCVSLPQLIAKLTKDGLLDE